MRIFIFTTATLVFIAANCFAQQQNDFHKTKISPREIIWGLSHPFIAIKVKRISQQALYTTDSLQKHSILKDRSGGNLDAFKHSYWMALLTQEIKAKKARKIGIIHEKVNYRCFKRNYNCQDSAASAMDLLNNEVGIKIGNENTNTPRKELIDLIINYIYNKKMYVIKKDSDGNCIDKNNKIIDITIEKKWNKRKCIIRSQ